MLCIQSACEEKKLMTRRIFNYGRIAALLLFGSCFGLGMGAAPAAAGGWGCGYGGGCYAPAPVIVQPSCSCCGCGGGGYGYGYGGYAANCYGYAGPLPGYCFRVCE